MAGRSTGLIGALLLSALLLAVGPVRAQVPKHCRNSTLSYDISFIGPLKQIKVGTVTYGYHRFGPLDKTAKSNLHPLIFLSGFGMYMYIHPIPVLQRSASDREVILVDHMRVGASNDSSRAPLTIPGMAASTAAFIKALKIEVPDMYGWSLGGAVLTAMAALHGSSFRYGVIINGYPGGAASWVMPNQTVDAFLAVKGDVNKYLDYLFPTGADDDGACVLFATWNSFYGSAYAKLTQPISAEVIRQQYAANQRFYADESVISALPRVRNRLLVFAGTQDRLVPVRNGALIANPVPGSWHMRFAREGHGLPFSSPRAVIYMMAEFWNFASPLDDADVAGMSYGVHPTQLKAPPPASPKAAPKAKAGGRRL